MTRPIFDTPGLWASLSLEQQRAIGVASIDREITIYGRDQIDGRMDTGDFEPIDAQSDDLLATAVEAVLDLDSIAADAFPLPSFVGGDQGGGTEQAVAPHGPHGSELFLRVAKQHGEESDTDHEVGDLQVFFRTAWLVMNEKARAAFVNHPDVRTTLADALFVDEDDPEEFRAALEAAAATADPTTPPKP